MPEGIWKKSRRTSIRAKPIFWSAARIIESGLDMPNVNTLIINQADRFGLTQLHQLRGRVGRGATLAYATCYSINGTETDSRGGKVRLYAQFMKPPNWGAVSVSAKRSGDQGRRHTARHAAERTDQRCRF